MVRSIVRIAVVAAAVSTLAGAAFGAPPKKPKAPATLKCPACGMMMPSKKGAKTPVAVKADNGHVYYCCAGCDFAKTHAVKPAKGKM